LFLKCEDIEKSDINLLGAIEEKMDISELFPQAGQIQRIYCDSCGGYLDLRFSEFHKEVSGIDIHIMDLPELHCEQCDLDYMPEDSRFAVIYLHEQATKHGSKFANVTRNKTNQNFGFTQVPFIYDSDDYKYFPGLKRPHDEGFLTPVFFYKEVLLKYDSSPTYRLSFTSTTYGEIRRGDDFFMPFGINKHRKVIMWLGDIARLPVNEQYYLRSENIESDHSIGSEFYDGQIECKFTDHSREDNLFQCRSNFLELCFKRFGEKLAHLDDEVLMLAVEFNGPVVDTDKERRHVADTLNKIYIESFDNNALGSVLHKLGEEPKNLGSNKRIEKIMESIATGEDVSKIMCPFFVLYDLRVAYSHLGSINGSEKCLMAIKERLGIGSDAEFNEVYEAIVSQLTSSFNELSKIVENGT
jgi:hypothetical protein